MSVARPDAVSGSPAEASSSACLANASRSTQPRPRRASADQASTLKRRALPPIRAFLEPPSLRLERLRARAEPARAPPDLWSFDALSHYCHGYETSDVFRAHCPFDRERH